MVWDLQTMDTMNRNPKNLSIWEIGAGRYALGHVGQVAVRTTKRVASRINAAGQRLTTYKGVSGKRPRIPAGAKRIPMTSAGKLLLRALGLRN